MITLDDIHQLSPEEFEASLKVNGIPPRPAVLETLGAELRKAEPDLLTLEHALSSDVAIAAALIKTVNSPYFGLTRYVRSVREAITVLGLSSTSKVVACAALHVAFPGHRLDRFWDSSLKVASLSAWLVSIRRWPGVRPEDAYTFGLFRDCGIAVMLTRSPAYVEVLRKANTNPVESFTDIERQAMPLSHVQVGAMMTQSWWLPLGIIEAVRHHHEVRAVTSPREFSSLPDESATLIAIAQLAERLLQLASGLSETREWDKLGSASLERLMIDSEELPSLQRRAADQLVGGG